MFRFKSILSRIVCLHIIAVAMTSIFMPAALYWLLKSETNNLHRQSMHDNAAAIAQHLVVRPDGTWAINLPAGLRDIYSKAYGRYAYAVLDGTGKVLLSSLADGAALFPPQIDTQSIDLLQARHGSALLSGASVARSINGQIIWVQVGENLEHRDVLIDDIVAEFFQRVGWVTLPILAILLAIDIAIFRRALQPLVLASERAKGITPKRADVRLPNEGIPQEVTPLVSAMNQALDRLEQGLRVQREFTADAAHELRTPLAILRMRVDTLPTDRISTELRRDIEGMCRIANQLLAMAELEGLVIDPKERTDLSRVCAEVVEALAPLAVVQGKDVVLKGADASVWVRGNSELLRTAIRNLVENAINHTREGTDVEIVVEQVGQVGILDRGPGIPIAERELIFQRFWRRDRQREGSAGLGLAIVRRIVEAHGASISVRDRSSGGAEFLLRLVPAQKLVPIAGEAGVVPGNTPNDTEDHRAKNPAIAVKI